MLLEKRNDTGRGVEHAAGFGFDVEVNPATGLGFHARHALGGMVQILGGGGERTRAAEARAPAQRQSRDAAFGAAGQQACRDIDQIAGVVETGLLAPVRLVDPMLDNLLVKVAVRKSVPCAGEQPMAGEPLPEFADPVLLEQLSRCRRRQPQAHAHRLIGAYALLDGQRVALEILEHFLARHSGMHIRAVAEYGSRAENITHHSPSIESSSWNFSHCRRKRSGLEKAIWANTSGP